MATALVRPDEMEKVVSPVVTQAQGLTVIDKEDYEFACNFLQFIATRKKQVEETFDPIIEKAHAAHKEALNQKKKFMDPLIGADVNVRAKVSQWRNAEERKRQDEERRLQEQAKREADERALQEAAALEASGDKELAQMVIEEAASAPAPVVVLPTMVPKQEGVSARRTWKFRIVNESLIPREFLMVNEVAIRAMVKAQKNMTKIPGVEVYPDDSVSVRG